MYRHLLTTALLSAALLVGALGGLSGNAHAGDASGNLLAAPMNGSTSLIISRGYLSYAEAAVEAERLRNLGWITTVVLGDDGYYYVDGI